MRTEDEIKDTLEKIKHFAVFGFAMTRETKIVIRALEWVLGKESDFSINVKKKYVYEAEE